MITTLSEFIGTKNICLFVNKKTQINKHMPNRKFYIEYQNSGNIVCQRIKRWADENRSVFPEYGFTNSQSDFPTTNYIANRLIRNFGFTQVSINNDVILKNANPNFRF